MNLNDEGELELKRAVEREGARFAEIYHWLRNNMSPKFFMDIDLDNLFLVVHNLMGFKTQSYYIEVHLKTRVLVLTLDHEKSDLKVLKHFCHHGVKHYRAYVSKDAAKFAESDTKLRVSAIYFTEHGEKMSEEMLARYTDRVEEAFAALHAKTGMERSEYDALLQSINPRFLLSMTGGRLIQALEMYKRAKTRDQCQYEYVINESEKVQEGMPSMQVALAWRGASKYNFLYRVAKTIDNHNLIMSKVNAAYIDPYAADSVLIMSLGLEGKNGKSIEESTDIKKFLKDLVTVKYFAGMQELEEALVDSGKIDGSSGNFLKSAAYFTHQMLVHADSNMYTLENVEEAFLRHPDLTVKLAEAFNLKFDPEKTDLERFEILRDHFLKEDMAKLDTGNQESDTRRRSILSTAMRFIDCTLKTNAFRNNKLAHAFRVDPTILKLLPYNTQEKFPELPYAIFFIKGMSFQAFHLRFKDLSRGGVRTVIPRALEQLTSERNALFSECYNLAYTQQKKNKDIPEGGSKAVILLYPYEPDQQEQKILRKELRDAGIDEKEIEEEVSKFTQSHELEHTYHAQRSFADALLTLINCEESGQLKAKDIIDYYGRPEYVYLGPDENMSNEMINWISDYSKFRQYKPGTCFMSSKPATGINHKEYGVTSLGVNVYMSEMLHFLGIDPEKEVFTVKMTGGPDGDVAGNQIKNLKKYYPNTAKLVALTDGSGTIYDPEGLELNKLEEMFNSASPINNYPPELLNKGGYLLDRIKTRKSSEYGRNFCLWKQKEQVWISGDEMNHLFRTNVHQTEANIFLPCGGRPRTLNENTWKEFLSEETGKPTSQAIIEGANLYLTPVARRELEKLGVFIIKDSSANKGGVITSSFEILSGLVMSEEQFVKEKDVYMPQVLDALTDRARREAQLMLTTCAETGLYLTDISEHVSEHINTFMYQILDYLTNQKLSDDPNDPLIRCLLAYCPKLLREKYHEQILTQIPDIHKKAIIASQIGARVVYSRGLGWRPTIVDILSLVAQDPDISGKTA